MPCEADGRFFQISYSTPFPFHDLIQKPLFQPQETPDDGLNQTQREAIVDLLNYCSFVDHSITINESDIIDGLEHQLHWDENTDFDYYENKSVGLVRGVLDQPGRRG